MGKTYRNWSSRTDKHRNKKFNGRKIREPSRKKDRYRFGPRDFR